jgi:hypothetical protein
MGHGKNLWGWTTKISALKEKMIVWRPCFDSPHSEIFIVTVDGNNFCMWEKKHPHLLVDRREMSHKFNHGAVKYEVAMSVFDSKCVWMSGPHRGGKHDMMIFREGLKGKIRQDKKVIVDRGYGRGCAAKRPDKRMLSQPNECDSKELNKFKSRARLRQENFNGRLKKYAVLENTFRHGEAKHKLVFEAFCVTVQYHIMNNGSQLYAIITYVV